MMWNSIWKSILLVCRFFPTRFMQFLFRNYTRMRHSSLLYRNCRTIDVDLFTTWNMNLLSQFQCIYAIVKFVTNVNIHFSFFSVLFLKVISFFFSFLFYSVLFQKTKINMFFILYSGQQNYFTIYWMFAVTFSKYVCGDMSGQYKVTYLLFQFQNILNTQSIYRLKRTEKIKKKEKTKYLFLVFSRLPI